MKVIYANWDSVVAEPHSATGRLRPNVEYAVSRLVEHKFHTDVYLIDFPGVAFNSVLFNTVVENAKKPARSKT